MGYRLVCWHCGADWYDDEEVQADNINQTVLLRRRCVGGQPWVHEWEFEEYRDSIAPGTVLDLGLVTVAAAIAIAQMRATAHPLCAFYEEAHERVRESLPLTFPQCRESGVSYERPWDTAR